MPSPVQLSVVHGLPSLHTTGAPVQAPPEHASDVVQRFPSLHGSVLFMCVQPVAGSHSSVVHGFPSPQPSEPVPSHAPAEHVSPVVHALPSSHDAVLFVKTHPLAGLHESVVHGLPSVQAMGIPPPHAPAEHRSPVVHALPSPHVRVLFT